MRRFRKIVWSVFTMVAMSALSLKGQDVVFSQYLDNTLDVNPAFAGISGNMEVFTAYRQERSGSGAQFETFAASFSRPSGLLHGGVGVELFRDAAPGGFISKNAVSLIYAYLLRLSRQWNVSAGFQTSFVQRYLNTNGMILPDMIDPVRGTVLPSSQTIVPRNRFYFDFQVGFLMYNKHWFTGLSAFHMLEPQESSVKLPETTLKRRFAFLLGHSMYVSLTGISADKLKLTTWGAYNYQSGYSLFKAGISTYSRFLSAGVGWQGGWSGSRHYVIPSLGLEVKNIRITYSYNVSVGTGSPGGIQNIHEITLKYFMNREDLLVVPVTINPAGF